MLDQLCIQISHQEKRFKLAFGSVLRIRRKNEEYSTAIISSQKVKNGVNYNFH